MLRGDYLAMIGSSSAWSRTQDKLFERALVLFPEDTPDRWERIAAEVPGKDPTEVRDHYEVLVHDVGEIDSGRVAVPSYTENSFTPEWWVEEGPSQISFGGGKGKGAENERKKGVPWTEEEHRLELRTLSLSVSFYTTELFFFSFLLWGPFINCCLMRILGVIRFLN